MKLYQYALIYQPKKNNKDNAAKAELIQPKDGGSYIQNVLANDEKQALMLAARGIPDSFVDKLDEVEIAIRPF